MATVRKRGKSRFWYAVVKQPTGAYRHFSTGLEDKSAALAVANATEAALASAGPGQLRDSLGRIADHFSPEAGVEPAAWLERWLEGRRGEVAPSSFLAYQRTVKEAAAWLRAHRIARFDLLTRDTLTAMRSSWAAKGSASTANKKMKHVSIALREAVRQGIIIRYPAEGLRRLRQEASDRRGFTADELARLLAHLQGNPEWLALTLLGLHTGQRLNDLAELRWSQIDFKAKTLKLTTRKTGAFTELPILAPVLSVLSALAGKKPNPAAYVLPRIAALAPSTRSNGFRSHLVAVGLSEPFREKQERGGRRATSPLSFHSLRHTATTRLKAAGVSDAVARAIIGHESAAVSRAYTHLDLATMREAMERAI